MRTIQAEWAKHNGIGPGFDTLRVALALLVVCTHSFLIVNGNFDYVDSHWLWAIFGPVVPMFFALSGFLISASAQRLRLRDFLLNRGLRIAPALAVDILVSALLIGPIVTSFSLPSYFAGKDFRHYFLNVIGFIHYFLPGVFLHNPWPYQVNGSLWTVPFEIGCYALMSLLIFSGAVKSRKLVVAATIAFSILYYVATFSAPFLAFDTDSTNPLHNYLSSFFAVRGAYLYFYFLGGVLLYFLRDLIVYSGTLAAICGAVALASWSNLLHLGAYQPLVMTLPVAYLVAFIGLAPIRKLPLYSRGDYSYGIYLYAYPLQQALVFAFPGRFNVPTHIACSITCATLIAMFSWHFIEKPFLAFRKKFSFVARKAHVPIAPNGDSISQAPAARCTSDLDHVPLKSRLLSDHFSKLTNKRECG